MEECFGRMFSKFLVFTDKGLLVVLNCMSDRCMEDFLFLHDFDYIHISISMYSVFFIFIYVKDLEGRCEVP